MELKTAASYGIARRSRKSAAAAWGRSVEVRRIVWHRTKAMTQVGLRRAAALCTFFLVGAFASLSARAQTTEINDLKGQIFDAKMAQQTFGKGLAHCKELDGTNFYFRQRDRVLDLEEYHRSLENLAQQRAFNPEMRRPWTEEDAILRWEQVQKQAVDDRTNCALIAHLPEMEKKLDELQKQTAAPNK
jgi:hypothetical protein